MIGGLETFYMVKTIFKTFLRHIYLLFAVLLANQASANDYETGRSAYISGDYERAFSILKPLAEEGDPEAQKVLAIMYDSGNGIEKNPQEALYWYIRSAEQGNPLVQYQVGTKYFHGDGTEQDYAEAAKWWELSANGGQVDAQFNLGLMYYRGLAMEKNDIKAMDLFKKAAEQGHGYAQYSLAVMYSFGQGVEKNYETALEWFRKSADQGVAQAQYNMGVYYENGYGVTVDLDKARNWYERASAQGLEEAARKLAAFTDTSVEEVEETPPEPAAIAVDEPGTGIKREAWVLSQPPDSYTLQIGSVLEEDDIIDFIRENGVEQESAYIEVVINGVKRYNGFYGKYSDFDDANEAINSLPSGLRSAKPWVRNFGILQKMLN